MRIRKGILGELGMIAVAILCAVMPMDPSSVERRFSTTTYPAIQRLLTPLTNLLPFSVLDLLSVGALVVVITALARAVRSSLRQRDAGAVARTVFHITTAAAVLYVAFLLLWGFNYRRIPMTTRLLVAQGSPSREAVVTLGVRASTELTALYDRAHQMGWEEPEWRNQAHRAAFAQVVSLLSDEPEPVPGRLKSSLFGYYFRWASVDGMTNPFGLETLVNPDLLPFERPFVAAHEWAHLAGFADESEANFIAWLACVRGDVPAQYSGWLALYWQISAEVDDEGRKTMSAALGAGPRSDLNAAAARVRSGEVRWLQTAGWKVYDKYLKANRVESGVRSYGAVVTLILKAQFQDGWVPLRRPPGS